MKRLHTIYSWRRLRLLVLAIFTLPIAAAPATGREKASGSDGALFNGEPRRFVVHGYSTSFDWPKVLQRKLDRFFEGESVIEVVTATKGGTPIAKWLDLRSGEPNEDWRRILIPAMSGGDGRPVYVLAQQSLQWVWQGRSDGIRNGEDKTRIREGAKAFQTYSEALLKEGAAGIFLATHIYKHGMEPQIGNERLALAELLKSEPKSVLAGPDVWEPTSKMWPQAFKPDKIHPNAIGAEIMAHHWFARLLESDGREVPEWSVAEIGDSVGTLPRGNSGQVEVRPGKRGGRGVTLERIARRHDKNGDGKIAADDFENASPSTDQDPEKKQAEMPSSKELDSPLAKLIRGLDEAHVHDQVLEKYGHDGAPVGTTLEDADVYSLNGEKGKLSALWEGRPLLLVSASTSCGPSCRGLPNMSEISDHFGGRVNVAVLYIVEAHPTVGGSPYNGGGTGRGKKPSRRGSKADVIQPESIEKRIANAQILIERDRPGIPLVIDSMENAAWKTVGKGPNIAVLTDSKGTVLHRQGWFNAREMAAKIEAVLESESEESAE